MECNEIYDLHFYESILECLFFLALDENRMYSTILKILLTSSMREPSGIHELT